MKPFFDKLVTFFMFHPAYTVLEKIHINLFLSAWHQYDYKCQLFIYLSIN